MARKLKIDFTDVETYVKCEEGEHVAILKEITEEEAKTSGNDMLVAKFEVVKGGSTGAIVYNNFVLVEKALWRLKDFCEAVGQKSDGKVMIDLDKLIGKKVIIVVIHEEYNGQTRANIDSFKKLGSGKVEEPEDDDEYEDDEEEEEAPPAKKKKSAPKVEAPATKKKKVVPEPDEDDEEDEEEEEDEPPVKKKKKPVAPPAKKDAPAKKKKAPVEDDDDEEDWEDD